MILTIGHSTRSLDELVELLHHHRVGLLADVRTVPASRRMPHFDRAALERALPENGIAYRHMAELGGFRKPKADSINTGWRNVSFRGYADYMQTEEFRSALDRLVAIPSGPSGHLPINGEEKADRMAIMCAEAVPWRCHRSLIADALTVRGVGIRHITGLAEPAVHRITPFALVESGHITYPAPDTLPI